MGSLFCSLNNYLTYCQNYNLLLIKIPLVHTALTLT